MYVVSLYQIHLPSVDAVYERTAILQSLAASIGSFAGRLLGQLQLFPRFPKNLQWS
jgi:hypothetical protein